MIRYLFSRLIGLCLLLLTLTLPGSVFGSFITFAEGGDNTTASIQDTVDDFREALGDPNNGNAPGPLPTGRREINWDGGGNNPTTAPAGTPFNGFLGIRGAQFTTPGTGFVQAPPGEEPGGTGGFDTFFNNPTLSSTFNDFSPLRIFSPVGSNITDVGFFIPGTNGAQPATVSGFGAIFTDVDLADSTSLQFFDIGDNLLFQDFVPAGTVSNLSFSFLGAIADAGEEIFRVRITSGNAAIASSSPGDVDIVAMDDFLYSEPNAVPETGGIGLLGLGLGFLLFYRRFWAIA
jgi:hypothetical protein